MSVPLDPLIVSAPAQEILDLLLLWQYSDFLLGLFKANVKCFV